MSTYYPEDLAPEEIEEFETEYDQWLDDQRKQSTLVEHVTKPTDPEDYYRRYEGHDYWEE